MPCPRGDAGEPSEGGLQKVVGGNRESTHHCCESREGEMYCFPAPRALTNCPLCALRVQSLDMCSEYKGGSRVEARAEYVYTVTGR